ncbi:efflux RND transporter periplasmic adaptor subunit [uncultured Fluviicola sp.]|uniref:efflux RND transporter periplasmic adaptor subunit n=1 Tax=uncultured Fluviicola sp. TaxID=463303 RepID=UPI0025E29BC3|nr:efflux RND transporter periplasmic adaptor subunit [uncultured Fluviicola sp.]
MKIFVPILLLIIVGGCSSKSESIHPKVQNISSSVYASGTIKSKSQYQAVPLVSGIIQDVFVDDGDYVKKGQLLIKIDNRSQLINEENAALSASYYDLGSNQDKLEDARNAIRLAREKLKTDSLMYVRQLNLFNQNVISKVELEQRELAYQSSQNALSNSIIRYNDLKRQINFSAKQAKNNLALSSKSVSDFEIRSDINGRVYSVLIEKGDLVGPQIPLAVIGSADSFILEMQVDEYDIAKVDLNMRVLVTMDSYKGQVFEARVNKINPLMNERSKTFKVEAVFTKAPKKIFPNTSFEANIVLESKKEVLTIPRTYLLKGDSVLLANGKKVKVKIGLRDFEFVEILAGLRPEDEIMLETE